MAPHENNDPPGTMTFCPWTIKVCDNGYEEVAADQRGRMMAPSVYVNRYCLIYEGAFKADCSHVPADRDYKLRGCPKDTDGKCCFIKEPFTDTAPWTGNEYSPQGHDCWGPMNPI
ncbi:MAG: hypothetical protein SFY95_06300 [Planctomycetota bacterium]|nr:hypothetical protein [Planctomycetota bacterium]